MYLNLLLPPLLSPSISSLELQPHLFGGRVKVYKPIALLLINVFLKLLLEHTTCLG